MSHKIGLLLVLLGGCSESVKTVDPAPQQAPDLSQIELPDLAAPPDLTPPVDECPVAAAECTGYDRRRSCQATPAGLKWVEEICASGAGCLQGSCTVGACSDECSPGQIDATGHTCQPVDITGATASALDPAGSLEDRARAYTMWLHRDGILHGGVLSAHYADPPTFSVVDAENTAGDSGFWTGTYLAAEALRLKNTGSADARDKVHALVDTLHFWWHVSGSPGLMTRYARPSGLVGDLPVPDLDCAHPNRSTHCGVAYEGKSYDYIGQVSRDIYQGLLLGEFLAYEALGPGEEATRAIIREDITSFVEELMKVRTVMAHVDYNGTQFTLPLQLPFSVLAPEEMKDGAIDFVFGYADDSKNGLWGYQEFNPDLATMVHEIPELSFVPSVPRSGVGIMLASAFQVALAVTDGVPSMATRRAAIEDFFLHNTGLGGNVNDWLKIVGQWDPGDVCAPTYWGHNNNMEAFYNLLRLETDPDRQFILRDWTLTQLMWRDYFKTQKNSWFAFIYAANQPSHTQDEIDVAVGQLAQFPVPPRIDRNIDLRYNPAYPEDTACPGQLDHRYALDVAVRPYGNFVWEHDPWTLTNSADTAQGEPGIDYLSSYWMARQHGFIANPAPSRCMAYR